MVSYESYESDDGIQWITEELMARVLEGAHHSPRRRLNHNFHRDLKENPHRFLNVMLRGTYIAPHRHRTPPKAESFLVLRGSLDFIIFNDDGSVRRRQRLGEGGFAGIDIRPGIWHTLVVTGDHAVCFEVKPGPYDPTEDKEFAPWAPKEGESGWEEYLRKLEN